MKTPDQLITEAKSEITEISVQELHEKYLQHPDIILIDVREPEEHQACAIDRAVNFPRGMLEMKIAQHPVVNHYCDVERALTNLAERDIYLLCGTGARSALATQALQRMGFEKVYSMQGGMQAWLEAGFPTVSFTR
ncbi:MULTISPECIES: rhodanese-like domain-containing protein [Acinetobacter]|jgi:rhodanese-related sulfurtransferase|uniref:Rhodanese-like domain-containing protein n=1 Tax=Acinetobacter towneri TaxID=202956 RepID=A0AAP9KJI0_9GAMM|nr:MULTISPECIES: rhodanese-like domain-containing protein [Acinetobacter]MBT0887644.1 rhodanese-like domain-containing protein [Acinetobacter towneri]MCA4788723.1 rhodanese-like domain-containing protein [Acinetobacter towneri]MCA4798267.1 rhodanese-like domain-containing protein [Acinetobacter towneri]MCA4813803.1 rhodanese-like domain-containing protein [Acinetobacter towneri]MCO8053606.1 rhodanese-like domain-containing protein [Acinetobacter towneri]